MNLEEFRQFVEITRGLVRPIALISIILGVVGFLAASMIEEAKMLALFGAPIIGFWFGEKGQERAQARANGQKP